MWLVGRGDEVVHSSTPVGPIGIAGVMAGPGAATAAGCETRAMGSPVTATGAIPSGPAAVVPAMASAIDQADAPSDESLLAGMAQGDEQAGVTFVRRYQRRVYGLAAAMVRDAGLAEDIAQEALIRAWRHAPVYDARRGAVSTWVLTITRNLSIDALRARRALPTDPDDLVALGLVSLERAPDDAAVSGEAASGLRAAISLLPVDQRRAVVLSSFYGLTAAEVAEREGIPLGTAKTRIRTALIRLRRGDGRRGAPMTEPNALPPECARYEPELAEFALGISTGRDRAMVLAHVEDCARCRLEVDRLSAAADSLLELVPPADPPIGFEVRLFERMRTGPSAALLPARRAAAAARYDARAAAGRRRRAVAER